MPPRRQAQPRVQISTRIPGELSERLRAFVRKHDTSVQAVVELALDEFLSRRES
jgi:predicted transcriptional regulator